MTKKSKKTLGILGGGQLARMMVPTLKKWDISYCVLDQEGCVAGPYTQDLREGSFRNEKDVLSLKDCERVSFDLEDISLKGIKELVNHGVQVHPSPEVMETIKDKGKQKDFFSENDIPTSPYKIVDSNFEELPKGFIKKCVGGYDGKGVFSWAGSGEFFEDFKTKVVWEEKVDFIKELSVIVVRDIDGKSRTYEPVEMVFNEELNLIDYTLSPAEVSTGVSQSAKKLASEIANKLNHVGVLAVEMFLLKDNSILVNELAPRPHNSGHHTIESCVTSQFENHLRAVCNYPLGSCEQKANFALTYNVLASGSNGLAKVQGLSDLLKYENVHVHLYGKKESRLGRKMGHVTITGNSKEEVITIFDEIKNKLVINGI